MSPLHVSTSIPQRPPMSHRPPSGRRPAPRPSTTTSTTPAGHRMIFGAANISPIHWGDTPTPTPPSGLMSGAIAPRIPRTPPPNNNHNNSNAVRRRVRPATAGDASTKGKHRGPPLTVTRTSFGMHSPQPPSGTTTPGAPITTPSAVTTSIERFPPMPFTQDHHNTQQRRGVEWRTASQLSSRTTDYDDEFRALREGQQRSIKTHLDTPFNMVQSNISSITERCNTSVCHQFGHLLGLSTVDPSSEDPEMSLVMSPMTGPGTPHPSESISALGFSDVFGALTAENVLSQTIVGPLDDSDSDGESVEFNTAVGDMIHDIEASRATTTVILGNLAPGAMRGPPLRRTVKLQPPWKGGGAPTPPDEPPVALLPNHSTINSSSSLVNRSTRSSPVLSTPPVVADFIHQNRENVRQWPSVVQTKRKKLQSHNGEHGQQVLVQYSMKCKEFSSLATLWHQDGLLKRQRATETRHISATGRRVRVWRHILVTVATYKILEFTLRQRFMEKEVKERRDRAMNKMRLILPYLKRRREAKERWAQQLICGRLYRFYIQLRLQKRRNAVSRIVHYLRSMSFVRTTVMYVRKWAVQVRKLQRAARRHLMWRRLQLMLLVRQWTRVEDQMMEQHIRETKRKAHFDVEWDDTQPPPPSAPRENVKRLARRVSSVRFARRMSMRRRLSRSNSIVKRKPNSSSSSSSPKKHLVANFEASMQQAVPEEEIQRKETLRLRNEPWLSRCPYRVKMMVLRNDLFKRWRWHLQTVDSFQEITSQEIVEDDKRRATMFEGHLSDTLNPMTRRISLSLITPPRFRLLHRPKIMQGLVVDYHQAREKYHDMAFMTEELWEENNIVEALHRRGDVITLYPGGGFRVDASLGPKPRSDSLEGGDGLPADPTTPLTPVDAVGVFKMGFSTS